MAWRKLSTSAWPSHATARRRFNLALDKADLWLTRQFQRATQRAGLMPVLRNFSRITDGPLWYGVLTALLLDQDERAKACLHALLWVGSINLLLYFIIKPLVRRQRPFVAGPGLIPCAPTLDRYSFPSGHMLHAISFAIVIITFYPTVEGIVWPCVLLIAFSRIALGLHYSSDVAAGAAFGTLTASAVLAMLAV